jgi:PAP2 superfamily
VLYAAYELLRGVGDASLAVARDHAGDIVELELALGIFVEQAVQDWASSIPLLPALLGLAYVTLHLGATGAALAWLHRSHPSRFPLVRNALVLSTALSLVGYVLYPAAPPRLSGHGFIDTVSSHTHVNLSSDLLGSLYNPFAAVPSMHFGYALIVGFAVAAYAKRPAIRLVGALYPPFMLFDIVATGNHFLFDAAMGGLVVLVAAFFATLTVRATAPAHA